jgi:hypothetical protein
MSPRQDSDHGKKRKLKDPAWFTAFSAPMDDDIQWHCWPIMDRIWSSKQGEYRNIDLKLMMCSMRS